MSRTRTTLFGTVAVAVAMALGVTPTATATTPASPSGTAAQPLTGGTAYAGLSSTAASADILDRVKAIPGVSDVVEKAAPAGHRFFTLNFAQPVDHKNPAKGTFKQRFTLLHRDVSRPTVFFTSGYYVSESARRSEPAAIIDGNQLSMEYRFFDPSRPARPDWDDQLTIWQAATDQHRAIQAFKAIYDQNWITTGGSKGGMTATYHRRFYPGDVDGTVPYVAPNDVRDQQDVYNRFLSSVGTDAACRDRIVALQRRTLTDRQWFLDRLAKESAAKGDTYRIVGSMDKAMESSIIDAYFAFWQYSAQDAGCAALPDPATATNDEVWDDFYQVHSPLSGYSDASVGYYTPYYYQAAYQMGSPEPYENKLRGLLRFPGSNVAATFVPKELKPIRFDRKAMPDVDKWVRKDASSMLYVYGSNDPWSAEPFTCGPKGSKRECYRYFVPGGNHGSTIAQLPEAQRVAAMNSVLRWAGLSQADPAVQKAKDSRKPNWNKQLDAPVVERRAGLL